MTSPNSIDVAIVGGGVAGLCCALRLQEAGIGCRIFEAEDRVGGRVKTDEVDGCLLDRGFQVLLTAYPEAQRVLDYEALDLRPFEPGALIRAEGKLHRLSDPWRRPTKALATLFSGAATLGDKMQVRRLRSRLTRLSYDDVFEEPEQPTLEALREAGFSRRMIERFFRPFLGGVFLDRELQTSSRMFYFVFRMFALGDAAVPARGMEQIPRQLVARLPEGTVRCSAPVASVTPTSVTLSGGESVSAKAVVVATEGPAAARLLGEGAAPEINTVARGVRCLYFAADESPLEEAVLVLSGEDGPVNNFCVMSEVSANYAPHGTSLMSATVLDDSIADEQLETQVRQQMTDWFGATVNLWRHLRTYRIPYGLPAQSSPALDPPGRALRLDSGIFLCGDHRDVASLQGAMLSGRRAADGVLEGLW